MSDDKALFRDQRRWQWLALVLLVGGLIWLLAPMLTPFVVSALLAWLGDPLVARLERAGRSRTMAVALVFTLMVLVLVLALLVLVLLLSNQVEKLVDWLPRLAQWISAPGPGPGGCRFESCGGRQHFPEWSSGQDGRL